MTLGRLHFISPPVDPLGALDAVLGAGLPAFQLRVKDAPDRALERLARDAVARCRAAGAQCVVDDRVDVALAAGADGVHVGDHDLSVPAVRAVAGPDFVVGATARDAESARARVREGATYLGVGPVFPTSSKGGLPDCLGLDGLAAVCAAVDVPVLAIAGITAERVPAVLEAGAHGVAVMGAIAGAPDPAVAVKELLEVLA